MPIRKTFPAILAGLLLLAPASLAGNAEQPAARQEKAAELLRVSGAANIGEQLIVAMLHEMEQQMIDRNPGHAGEIRSLLQEYFVPEAKAALPDLIRGLAGIYATQFTMAELDDIIRFYRTPTGSKLVQSLPMITQQSMAIGQVWGQGVGERAAGRFVEAAKARGLALPQPL
ncbi:DUF2059 domain-containing protein [Niveispirillum fermenti]|uniref:DUF2059 domain-containing protein n=1 Tax=Niveispirillum fermenti TaxID=1233113 RepID=UPI003A8ABFEF